MVFVDHLGTPVVRAEDARHLLDVLRLRPGEPVVASDGRGSWVPCRVAAASVAVDVRRGEPVALLDLDGAEVYEPEPSVGLTVAFTPVKGDRPEWVVQKLTELGVDRIVPLVTNRSVVRWEGDRAGRAVDRLRRVAREAACQCRRPRLPEVTGLSSLDGLAAVAAGEGIRPTLAHAGGVRPTLDAPVIAIGPEGGWDTAELDGASTVGLGPTVLRAETAAVVAGTLLCGLRSALVAPLA